HERLRVEAVHRGDARRDPAARTGACRPLCHDRRQGSSLMSLVFAGVCSHAPGITGRAHMADPALRDEFYRNLDRMRAALEASKPDAIIVIAAEHFANFFMNNMPAYCIGMGE